MTTALDVAWFFVLKGQKDPSVTQLKIQKLVYYAQAWSVVFRGQPLFDEAVEAWSNGPAVRSVWKEFNCYGKESVPLPQGSSLSVLPPDQIQLLEMVWEKYGSFSATELWALSHSEAPWIEARGDIPVHEKSQSEITADSMKSYYSNFASLIQGMPEINQSALLIEKGDTTFNLCMTNGKVKSVELRNLGEFIEEHAHELELIPGDVPKLRRVR
ncbi:hypothetical protein C8255_08870 [filamentous cyanobacterium CCP3]|nr:hypothetical protein C8255_08870 [filamentous cyanobacterium CCP3]